MDHRPDSRRLVSMAVCAALALSAASLAAAEKPALAKRILKAPANKWTPITADGGAGCFASGTVYMPPVNALISWGTRIHSAKFTRHEVCHVDLEKARVIEAFPPGKEKWTPRGIAGWKFGGTVGFSTRDGVKLPRRILMYEQMAWDAPKERVVYYMGTTFAYDPVTRLWQDLKPKGSPPFQVLGATMCYDAAAKRIVLFGGFGAEVPYSEVGTWFYDCANNTWSKPEFNPQLRAALDASRGLGVRARTLRRDAQYLLGLAGGEQEKAEAALSAEIEKLAKDVEKPLGPLQAAKAPRTKQDAARASAGAALISRAAATVKKARSLKGTALVAALEKAEDLLFYRAVEALRAEPSPRCNADMVYDTKNGVVVLFGGDHLDMKLSDTWVLDTKKGLWTRRKLGIRPVPQSTHSMAYLEKSGLVFLASTKGNWVYDAGKNVWKPVPGKTPVKFGSAFRVTGVPGTDIAMGLLTRMYGHTLEVFAYRLDPAGARAKHKSAKGCPRPPLSKRSKFSRKWYDDLPAPDPAAFAAKIKSLPENKWTPLPGKKEIRARTWSSCTYDNRRRELIYWGGGHSGNTNSNVDHFSMRTGRWSRNLDSTWKPWPYGAMAACPNGRTYYDEPWTMHARKTYAYDPVSGLVAMAFVGGGGDYRLRNGKHGRYTWMYDPRSGAWVDRIDTPFKCRYAGAAVTTPKGVMLLDNGQVWKLNLKARKWEKFGPRQRMGGGEYDTMTYDSKRDRLVYLQGNVHYFPLATKKWKRAKAGGIRSRDAVYVPSQDAVLAHVGSGKFKILLCADEKVVNGPAGNFKGTCKGISEHAVTMDPETETVLWIDAHGFTGPFTLKALKLNVKKLSGRQ